MSEQIHFQDETGKHLQDENFLALLVLFFLYWWVVQIIPFIIDVCNSASKHDNSLKMPVSQQQPSVKNRVETRKYTLQQLLV